MIGELILLVTTLYLLYKYLTATFDHWEKKGVAYIQPIPIFGNFKDSLLQRKQIGQFMLECYNKMKESYFGMYMLSKPVLVVKDPHLIKSVLVKDFSYFTERTTIVDEKVDPVTSKILFFSQNPHWKFMRTRVSPVFTSGKLKNLTHFINKAGEDMAVYLNKQSPVAIEAKEVCAKYSVTVTASCVFGIDAHCFENDKAEFREIARKMFSTEFKNAFRQSLYFLSPSLAQRFRIPFLSDEITGFLKKMILSTIEQREKSNYVRNDLVDIMVQMKNNSKEGDLVKFEGDWLVALAGQFYFAGTETVSSTLSFALYELCLQPKIQQKLRTEIKEIKATHKTFTAEVIQQMKYLHMVVAETVRKYPVLPFLDRRCVEDYQLPNSNVTIEKGTLVYIPLQALHLDPKYFPEPEKFEPERFTEENKAKITPYSYIPFGEGPRICIGERFGLLATKMGIVHILSNFEIERAPETPVPIEFVKKGFLLASTVGIPLKFTPSKIDL